MGKFKDRFNKLMRPNVSKPKESEDARAPVTASKSLTDSAEQEPASLSKAYRSASHSKSLQASMRTSMYTSPLHMPYCAADHSCTYTFPGHLLQSITKPCWRVAGKHQQLPASQKTRHQRWPSMAPSCSQSMSCLLPGQLLAKSRTLPSSAVQRPTVTTATRSHTVCAQAAHMTRRHLATAQTTSHSPPAVDQWITAPWVTPRRFPHLVDTPCQMASPPPLKPAAAVVLQRLRCLQYLAGSLPHPTWLQACTPLSLATSAK